MSVPDPCPRCLRLAWHDEIRPETIMPLEPEGPLALEDLGEHSPAGSRICHDCQAAENLAKVTKLAAWVATEPGGEKRPLKKPDGLSFAARRIVVGNERQEQLRLPVGMRPHFGLVALGFVRQSYGKDALEQHHRWLVSAGIWAGEHQPFGPELVEKCAKVPR